MHAVVFFASGQGSNIRAILEYFKHANLVQPALIVSNKPNAGANNIALENNIPLEIVDRDSLMSEYFLEKIKAINPSLIVLAGFLWKIPASLVAAFPNKIINIHPALLPNYGGKGMYGAKVHEAVIAQQEKESGITIHYVNENFDEGNHICQAHCKVTPEDTPDTLAQKVHQLEHFFFPRTIEFLLKNH